MSQSLEHLLDMTGDGGISLMDGVGWAVMFTAVMLLVMLTGTAVFAVMLGTLHVLHVAVTWLIRTSRNKVRTVALRPAAASRSDDLGLECQ